MKAENKAEPITKKRKGDNINVKKKKFREPEVEKSIKF